MKKIAMNLSTLIQEHSFKPTLTDRLMTEGVDGLTDAEVFQVLPELMPEWSIFGNKKAGEQTAAPEKPKSKPAMDPAIARAMAGGMAAHNALRSKGSKMDPETLKQTRANLKKHADTLQAHADKFLGSEAGKETGKHAAMFHKTHSETNYGGEQAKGKEADARVHMPTTPGKPGQPGHSETSRPGDRWVDKKEMGDSKEYIGALISEGIELTEMHTNTTIDRRMGTKTGPWSHHKKGWGESRISGRSSMHLGAKSKGMFKKNIKAARNTEWSTWRKENKKDNEKGTRTKWSFKNRRTAKNQARDKQLSHKQERARLKVGLKKETT